MRATTHGLLPKHLKYASALRFTSVRPRRDRRAAPMWSIRHPSIRRLLACASVRTLMGASARARVPFVSRPHCLPSEPFASSHPPGRMLQVARRASRPPRCRRRRMPTGTPGRPLELGLANERRRRADFGEGVLRCAHALRPTQQQGCCSVPPDGGLRRPVSGPHAGAQQFSSRKTVAAQAETVHRTGMRQRHASMPRDRWSRSLSCAARRFVRKRASERPLSAESLTWIDTDASHRKMRNGHRGKPSELAERSRARSEAWMLASCNCVVLWFLPPVSRAVQRPVLCCGVGFTGERDQEFSISAD